MTPAQIRQYVKSHYAFGLPSGSVRALLVSVITSNATNATIGPPPLYLPRGSVRSLLLAGSAALAGALIYQHRIGVRDGELARLSHAGVTLILVAGFMLGVIMGHLTRHGLPRWVEDTRATASLAAGALLLLLVFGLVHVPDSGRMHDVQRWALQYRVEDVLAAVVGFYFGSRS